MKKKTKQLHHSSIPLSLSVGLLSGFACLSFTHSRFFDIRLLAFVFFFCLVNAFIFRGFGRLLFAFCAGALVAMLRFQSVTNSRAAINQRLGKTVEISLKVSTDPTSKNESWRFDATSISLGGVKLDSLFYATLADTSIKPQRGDRLLLRAKIQDGFGKYDAYISRPELIELSKPDPPDIGLKIRNKFASLLEYAMGSDHKEEVALGLGYLTGQKDSMPEELSQKLKNVGLAHVVVASGFHLGLIANLFRKLFKKVSRFASYFAAVIAMISFISITGLSASMLRAGLVTGLSL
jgi:competence protein ComEC